MAMRDDATEMVSISSKRKRQHLQNDRLETSSSLINAPDLEHIEVEEPPSKRQRFTLLRPRPSRRAIRQDLFRRCLAPEPCRDIIFATASTFTLSGSMNALGSSSIDAKPDSNASSGLFSFGGSAASTGTMSSGTTTTGSTGSIFGSSSTNGGTSSGGSGGAFLFGTGSTSSGGTSLFGAHSSGNASSSGSGGSFLFGSSAGSTASTGSSGGSLFGASTSGGSIFGASTSGGSLFGASTSGGSLFGASTSSGSLLGAGSGSTLGTSSAGAFQFGVPSNAPNPSIFGGIGGMPAAFGSGGGFGPPAPSNAGGLFGQVFQQQPAGRGRGKRRAR